MRSLKPTNIILCFFSLLNKNQSVKQKTCSHNCESYTDMVGRMGSCMLIFSLGVLLIFLSSCSTSVQNPSATPSFIADENNTADPSQSLLTPTLPVEPPQDVPPFIADETNTTAPSQSPLTPAPSVEPTRAVPPFIADESNTTSPSQSPLAPTPSVKPTQDVPHIRPTRPFPDFPPNYLQFLSQELLNDFDNGNFVVGEDGIAANYQAWHEFIGKVNKNKDAALTIQTFYLDLSKEVNDSTRYQLVGRYHLSMAANQAVWKYLSDDKNDVSGKLSFVYDAETGLHEVFIEEKKVFEFIYFPPDPEQIALYFGYTPLEELPSVYTREDAVKDGCLVIEQGVIQNINVLTNYTDSFGNNDVGIFIRIFFEDDEGISIMDMGSYNERVCVTVDFSRYANRDDIEDMYVTTHYDNSVVSVLSGYDVCSLLLGSDFRETVFIFEDVPVKKD